MSDANGPHTQDDPGDEDFAEAWEHGDDLDVGADTSQFETFQGNDTAELLRRKVRGGDDDPDAVPDLPQQQDPDDGASGGPPAGVVIGVLAVVFVIVAVLYLLG